VLARDGRRATAEVSLGELEQELFDMPVSLSVDGVVLLDHRRIPIYYLALEVDRVRQLPVEGEVDIQPPGGAYLRLRWEDGAAEVESLRETWISALADYSELLNAWEEFAKKVRGFFLEHFPSVAEHRRIGKWLREG